MGGTRQPIGLKRGRLSRPNAPLTRRRSSSSADWRESIHPSGAAVSLAFPAIEVPAAARALLARNKVELDGARIPCFRLAECRVWKRTGGMDRCRSLVRTPGMGASAFRCFGLTGSANFPRDFGLKANAVVRRSLLRVRVLVFTY